MSKNGALVLLWGNGSGSLIDLAGKWTKTEETVFFISLPMVKYSFLYIYYALFSSMDALYVTLPERCFQTPTKASSDDEMIKWPTLLLFCRNRSAKQGASVLWNAMIHPYIHMPIYGAIWYQGKSSLCVHCTDLHISWDRLSQKLELGQYF